jgi:hypothetical protein
MKYQTQLSILMKSVRTVSNFTSEFCPGINLPPEHVGVARIHNSSAEFRAPAKISRVTAASLVEFVAALLFSGTEH